jgi:nucleoside-diphosphate-sugar epimerase
MDLGRASIDELSAALARVGFANAHAFFHVAGHVKMWGPYDEFYRSNVVATDLVIALCRQLGIEKLIFTSSPSVVADGKDLRGVDETYPYPDSYLAHYPKTKAIAERAVLRANDGRLKTCALRPHLIFGPGDTNLAPTIIKKAVAGQLVRIGAGENLVDFCYIDDCVHAHLLAEQALSTNSNVAGEAFFITQGDPTPLWFWVDRLLELSGMSPLSRSVSPKLAYAAATVFELVATITGREPRFSRFLVKEMATEHYFSIAKARRELGFSPSLGVMEALEKTFKKVVETSGQQSSGKRTVNV